MPLQLATADDVADIWRPLTDDEQTRAQNLIAKASALLRAACPFDIDERIGFHTTDSTNKQALDPALVAVVVAGIVKRVMVNPDDAVTTSETVGGISHSTTFTGTRDLGMVTESRGGLVVEPGDLAALLPAIGYTEPFTIKTKQHRRHGSAWRS